MEPYQRLLNNYWEWHRRKDGNYIADIAESPAESPAPVLGSFLADDLPKKGGRRRRMSERINALDLPDMTPTTPGNYISDAPNLRLAEGSSRNSMTLEDVEDSPRQQRRGVQRRPSR